jgi:hypothetical protein
LSSLFLKVSRQLTRPCRRARIPLFVITARCTCGGRHGNTHATWVGPGPLTVMVMVMVMVTTLSLHQARFNYFCQLFVAGLLIGATSVS